MEVAANTPVIKEELKGKNKTIHYDKTPAIPSYLLALTVGELDKTPITGLSVPGYVYSPKGTGNQTGYAIEHTPKILEALMASSPKVS